MFLFFGTKPGCFLGEGVPIIFLTAYIVFEIYCHTSNNYDFNKFFWNLKQRLKYYTIVLYFCQEDNFFCQLITFVECRLILLAKNFFIKTR